MQLSILIVNFNTESFIEKLLLDLRKQTLPPENYEIIITNNVQNETLTNVIQQNCELKSLNINIIESAYNVGFGRAMNMAAEHATGKHLLIANPDLRMLQHDYLEKILTHAEQHSDYGLITTQLINDDGEDKSEFREFEFHETFGFKDEVNWFSGALILVRHSVMQQVNGFDPDFFMYCEDEDLCLRIKLLGLNLVKLNDLKIYHKGGSSEPYQNYDFFSRWYRSQILFAYKHFSKPKFDQLIQQLSFKAKFKCIFYKFIALLIPTPRHRFQYAQWSAMRDIIKKTLNESPEWLYFKH